MKDPIKKIDLHIHSTFSDGQLTPGEIVECSKRDGVSTIAICDHDSISGIDEAVAASKGDIEIIPATELSANIGKVDIHLLGYYIDYKNSELAAFLAQFQRYRLLRIKRIVEKLYQDGVRLNFERITEIAGQGSIGRPHIAQSLLAEGYVHSIGEAFGKYLGYHCPYYEPKKSISPKEAIKKIKDYGGIPVFAHPGTIKDDGLVYQLIEDGIAGIEVWHPEHSNAYQQQLLAIAIKNSLLVTGGSDYHGNKSHCRIGKPSCPAEDLLSLKRYHLIRR